MFIRQKKIIEESKELNVFFLHGYNGCFQKLSAVYFLIESSKH